MPRRYGPDGSRLWNGKAPEDFNQADVYRFMAETEAVLQKRELLGGRDDAKKIAQQLAEGRAQAARENAARPAPAGAQGNRRHRPLHAPARSPGPGADRLHSRFPQAFGHPLPHGIQRHAFFPLRVSGQSSSMGRSTARQWDNTVPR